MPACRNLALCFLWLASSATGGCALDQPYLDPNGPRFAGDHRPAGSAAPPTVTKLVSYNLEFGRQVDAAVAALRTDPLANADLIAMQEMTPEAVEEIAVACRRSRAL